MISLISWLNWWHNQHCLLNHERIIFHNRYWLRDECKIFVISSALFIIFEELKRMYLCFILLFIKYNFLGALLIFSPYFVVHKLCYYVLHMIFKIIFYVLQICLNTKFIALSICTFSIKNIHFLYLFCVYKLRTPI